jgi:hypothetical protein
MISSKDSAAILRFSLALILTLLIAYAVQVFVFSFPSGQNLLNEAYLFNFIYALASFAALKIMNQKNPGLTGFAFMAASALKFLFFFLAFYPSYYADGIVGRSEFLSFFVPYAICLILETVVFIKY